jgi:hypothetical protein
LSDGTALEIVDVLREGLDTYADVNIRLDFDGCFEDDRPFFRLRAPQAGGTTLIARYTKPYTISGLDNSTSSTLPALYDVVLLDGAAWQACLVRAAGRIETINMNSNVSPNFERMADHFRQAFELGLNDLGRRRFPRSACTSAAGTGEPVTRGWDDQWVGQIYRMSKPCVLSGLRAVLWRNNLIFPLRSLRLCVKGFFPLCVP